MFFPLCSLTASQTDRGPLSTEALKRLSLLCVSASMRHGIVQLFMNYSSTRHTVYICISLLVSIAAFLHSYMTGVNPHSEAGRENSSVSVGCCSRIRRFAMSCHSLKRQTFSYSVTPWWTDSCVCLSAATVCREHPLAAESRRDSSSFWGLRLITSSCHFANIRERLTGDVFR